MEKVLLFKCRDIKNRCKNKEVINNYNNFVDEVLNDKPITSYPELEPFRDNIKLLIDFYWEDINNLDGDDYFLRYIDGVVALSKELGDIKLSFKLINTMCNDVADTPGEIELLYTLEALYCPKNCNRGFRYYLNTCLWMINWYLDIPGEAPIGIVTGNYELNAFFNYLSEMARCGITKYYDDYFEENKMIALIFAYLHYHGIYNYELIIRYLTDKDYYKEKIYFNNCEPYDIYNPERVYYYPNYYEYEKAELLFNHMEEFFEKKNESIK